MSKQLTRNRQLILILMAMTFVPFIIAWVLSKNTDWLSSSASTNNGNLIIPAVTTERSELSGFDQFSMDNLSELNRHWVMVNVIPGQQCNEICREAIVKTRQLRLMMNKDLTRIRRLVLLLEPVNPELAEKWWQDDSRLLRAKPNVGLMEKIQKITHGKVPDGILLLMDPFGNLMMHYGTGFDPYAVKADLKKLLRISQIG